MKWIGNNFEKRVNPKLVLENTQSVISLSVNYFTDFKHESSGGKNFSLRVEVIPRSFGSENKIAD